MPEPLGGILNARYQLDAELGRGAVGVVYRAHDVLLDRAVALKIVGGTGIGTEGRARLLREARAAAQLNHPNIVAMHDAGEFEGITYIVMELVEGGSLASRRPETLGQLLDLAQQVCAGLEHAHSRGIVHRDLKPENVLAAVGSSGQIIAKLADFGLARSIASRLTKEGTIAGTVFYLAPEQALGQPVDGRADLYALGVMLYELATGELPFSSDDPLAVITQHLHAPPIPPRARKAEIPAALESLILKLLSKNAADRPASASEVGAELEAMLAQAPLAAADTSSDVPSLDRIARGRMVGREAELAQARALWRDALAGRGHTLLISGEPGIGKSRLVREILTHVSVSGGLPLEGTCYAEGGVPYAPFGQIVERALQNGQRRLPDLPPFVLSDLLKLAPALWLRYPNALPAPPLDDPQAEQHRLFQNVALFFAALCSRAPTLVVLEDAHWADSGSLALLRHLARQACLQRTLLAVTYREVELDEALPLQEVLLDLSRERLATRVKLGRLDAAQTGDMLGVLLGTEASPEFADGVYRETEGNPFYVEEVCKALVESGQLRHEQGRWRRPAMEDLGIPQSVRVAIQTRVRRLPPEAQHLLRVAAVLGREFDLPTLADASGRDEDTLAEGLSSALHAQLIDELPLAGQSAAEPRAFTFAHGLIPAALTDNLPPLERRQLHRRAAAAIERNRRDDSAGLETLAYHYSQAGDTEAAVTYLVRAGDRARGLYANQEARRHYQQALGMMQSSGDLERSARTLMKLGLAHHNAFQFSQARRAFEESFAQWQRLGEAADRAVAPAPHPLRLNWAAARSLDPAYVLDEISATISQHLFSGLVAFSSGMDVVPDVARAWDVLDAGRRYVFHLHADATWSDGERVTANDFEYAWKRLLAPATGAIAQNAQSLYDIRGARAYHTGASSDPSQLGVRALDDTTLEVLLEAPVSFYLQLLAGPTAVPVPRHIVGRFGGEWARPDRIVSNGPFRLVQWECNNQTIIERRPGFHRQLLGNVQQVILSNMPAAEVYQAYEEGALDLAFVGEDQQVLERLRQRHPEEYVSAPLPLTAYVAFDVTRPPFDDRRVRRALALATDREYLAGVALQGDAFPAVGGLVPPGIAGHAPGIALPFDPVLARRALAEAGFPNGAGFPDVTCLAADTPSLSRPLDMLVDLWAEHLGLSLHWTRLPWQELMDNLVQRPPMWAMAWMADYPDPDSFLRVAEWRPGTRWTHAQFDELVEDLRNVADQEQRIHIAQRADRILVEEAPILPLIYARSHVLVKPWVRMSRLSLSGRWQWHEIVLEPH